MYCVKCGVKLADTEKSCPLCQTPVYHPQLRQPPAKKLYPPADPKLRPASKGLPGLLTIFLLLPVILVLLIDRQISGGIVWSGYVIGALGLFYLAFVLPLWFQKPNPVIFVPAFFAALCLYLHYINFQSGGNWFLTFALPVTGLMGAMVSAVVTLVRYIKKGRLYIFGGATILLGIYMLPIEFMANFTFAIESLRWWSLYPLVVLTIFGGLMIYLAVSATARQTLERKFFI